MRPLMMVLAAIAVAGIGCGGEGNKTSVVTCELRDSATHWCYEIPTSTLQAGQITALQQACVGLESGNISFTMNEGGCPASTISGSRSGVCTTTSRKATESSGAIPWWYEGLPAGLTVKISYYEPFVTSTMGRSICTDSHGGTWADQ